MENPPSFADFVSNHSQVGCGFFWRAGGVHPGGFCALPVVRRGVLRRHCGRPVIVLDSLEVGSWEEEETATIRGPNEGQTTDGRAGGQTDRRWDGI